MNQNDKNISSEKLDIQYCINKIKKENDEYYKKTAKKKKYLITTYGCQMNEHDSEKISWILENMGYIPTSNIDECNLIIYNTCLVRENAELKVYGKIGELKRLKKQNPNMVICICGCMMQRKKIRDYILNKFKHVDIIFGTNNIYKLPSLIEEYNRTKKTIVDIVEGSRKIKEDIGANRKYSFKAFVNIMYGCNNFCTYCIVPYTRGREESREPENIINEIKHLAQNGYKEITLLGQNVNSYGKTLKQKCTFANLLRKINEINGIERIRFMTSHPKDLSDDLIRAIRDCEKVCNHIHLPVQSGSNKILKLMNRNYTREDYLLIIEKLRKEIPEIAITTDIIVGFPGETKEDFNETLDLIKKSKYDSAFTFLYSIREGTKAAKMENQIPDKIKHKRFEELLQYLYPIFYENNFKYENKVVEVLVEEISKTNDKVLTGRTKTNKLVHFEGNSNLIGKFVNVKITKAKTFTLEGYLV